MMPLHETVPARGVASGGGIATVAATGSNGSRAGVAPSTGEIHLHQQAPVRPDLFINLTLTFAYD